jgi:hypothetical protein
MYVLILPNCCRVFCILTSSFRLGLQLPAAYCVGVWVCRELLTTLRSRMPSNVARNLLENLGSNIAAPHTRRCTRRSTTTSTAALALSLLRSPPATEMSAQFALPNTASCLVGSKGKGEGCTGLGVCGALHEI